MELMQLTRHGGPWGMPGCENVPDGIPRFSRGWDALDLLVVAFLDPAKVARMGNLPLKARIIVEGALSGLHRARLHGASVEFAEHKEYSPGDEIRHIDWKAFAKVDRYYVKQFEQESQLTVHLVLDSSASMAYGGGKSESGISKLEYASYLIASLAHLLIGQRDRVGLSIFGNENIDAYVPPRGRPAHLRDLFAVIDEVNQRGAVGSEPARAALDRLAELTRRRRSLIILASDLLASGRETMGRPADPTTRREKLAPTDTLRLLKAQGHDVVLFHILHPDELGFPFQGLTLFESLEDERKLLANPEAIKREYLRALNEFLEETRAACMDSGVEYHLVSTDQPLEQTLLELVTGRVKFSAARRAWSS